MNVSINLKQKIDEIRMKAVRWDDVIFDGISNSFGIIIIFSNIANVKFEKYEVSDEGVDPYLLNKHIEIQSNDILYFKLVKDLKKEVKQFKCKSKKKLSKPGIIFSQISNKIDLKVGYVEVTEQEYKTGRINEQFSEIMPVPPVMNVQFKSNDAAPSWNGFNYQGFVTVLRTLEYMNRLTEEEYENYSVEIEKYEDFIIYQNSVAKELFQVKAYVTEKSMSSYKEACEKLINHKGQVGSSTATCFLATAAGITGWDKSKYADEISLYGYKNGDFVATVDIIDHIKREITTFFDGIDGSQGESEVEMAFACISLAIINKIDYLHRHRNARDEEYRIMFSEIATILKDAATAEQEHKLFFTKLEIDKKILANFDIALSDYCDDCEKESCELCPLNDLRESFESINRETYAKIIDPTVTIDDANIYVAEVFSGLRIGNILDVFESVDLDMFVCDNKHIYIVNNNGIDDYLEKIIPSLIDIKRDAGLSRVLKGIQNDSAIQRIYDQSAVIAEMPDRIIRYENQKIHVIPESILGRKVENKDISISPKFNFNLINKETFVKRSLENE